MELVIFERWTDCDESTSNYESGYNCNKKTYITSFDDTPISTATGAFTVDTNDLTLAGETYYMAIMARPVGSTHFQCTVSTTSHPYSNCLKFKIKFKNNGNSDPCVNSVLMPATTALEYSTCY